MTRSHSPSPSGTPEAELELTDEELECVVGGVSRIPVARPPAPAR